MRYARTTVIGVALAAGFLSAPPAHADWLVLHDGTRVETDGEWSVQGRLVVFKTAAGKLASMRAAEVDLAASERATAEAQAPPPAPSAAAEPRRKATVVLTDADIPRAEAEPPAEGEAADGAAPKEGAGEGPVLEVGPWQQVDAPGGDGIQVYGTVTNKSAKMATDLALKLILYDTEGGEVASGDAVISRKSLAPGTSANFSADFAGVFSFASLKFVPTARTFETRALPSPAPAPGGEPPPPE